MTLHQFCRDVGARMTSIEKRGLTGVLSFGLEVNSGRPKKGYCRFHGRSVLRRSHIEAERPSKMLDMCYREALQLDSRFFGRVEVEYVIFEGNVVDTKTLVAQTFACVGS